MSCIYLFYAFIKRDYGQNNFNKSVQLCRYIFKKTYKEPKIAHDKESIKNCKHLFLGHSKTAIKHWTFPVASLRTWICC